jgi:hypothetical protein
MFDHETKLTCLSVLALGIFKITAVRDTTFDAEPDGCILRGRWWG